MAVDAINPRKRRRGRRRVDRPAISARLLLDDRLKGEYGYLSDDLLADLFPSSRASHDEPKNASSSTYFVAVTPWTPSATGSPQSHTWTILPVKSAEKNDTTDKQPHSSIHFPAGSLALQSFLQTLQTQAPTRTLRRDTPIEIRVTEVAPVALDTIFVTLDTDALRKLDEVHAKFGGGFDVNRINGGVQRFKSKQLGRAETDQHKQSAAPSAAQQQTWRAAVRKALSLWSVVHSGDLLPLPLPSHPITHVPAPPAKVTTCEPVSQGFLLPSTRIVLLQSHRQHEHATERLLSASTPSLANGIAEEDEDTSNEQFFSAAEEKHSSGGPSPPDGDTTTDDFDSALSGAETDDLSDDSEDMISLNAPLLPPQSSGIMSSFTAATPRAGGYTNGIATPGSVMTSTTVRGGAPRSKVFQACGLLERIPDELVHPKPSSEDDEEIRIFVDTASLTRIGCFSGDWIRLEAAEEPAHGLASFGFGALGNEHGDEAEWRAAKVFALPENASKKPGRYQIGKSNDRRSSFYGAFQPQTSSQAYLSPLLLYNLGSPSHLKLSPLAQAIAQSNPKPSSRITSILSPPVAKEVTLVKISTPLSTDMVLQPSLFSAVKHFFEQKRRTVKNGDLIAITVDEALGKATYQGNNPEDPESVDEFLRKTAAVEPSKDSWSPKAVAWFRVDNITLQADQDDDGAIWDGVTTIDAGASKLVTAAASGQDRAPPAASSSWQYYLQVRRPPVSPSQQGFAIQEMPKPYISPLRRRLRELLSATTSPRAVHLNLPPLAILLYSTQRQIGKASTVTLASEDLGLHTFALDAFDIVTEGASGGGDVKTEAVLKSRCDRALACGAQYTTILIKHIEALNADRMTTAIKEVLSEARVLVATTTEIDKIPDGIRSVFTHELEVSAPDESEREGLLRSIVDSAGVALSPDVDLSSIAVKTAALVAGDLQDVVSRALTAHRLRLEALATQQNSLLSRSTSSLSVTITVRDLEIASGPHLLSLSRQDFDTAVDAARKNFADSIGAPKIPNVSWSDVGGLSHVKSSIMETIQLPLSRPELFAKGMKKRSGILFYGPPGTGKTLLAKAIATEFSLNFFSVKGPELLNMYIGESEANVRRVFQRARDARPCVVFFDELDSVAPKRGNQGDSGGVMDRIVSQLLAELDGMSSGDGAAGGVFVIGATNRPDLLDQALLRPGRFDKMLYLGVSDTHEKQQKILEALSRKFTLDPSLSLARIAATLPFTYSGADLYALCSDAMLKAITRASRSVDARVRAYNDARPERPPISIAYYFDHLASDEDTKVVVQEEDFLEAKKELVPSVSVQELQHYDKVRRTFEGDGKKGEEQRPVSASATKNATQTKSNLSNARLPSRTKAKPAGKGKGKGKTAPVNDEDDEEDADVSRHDLEESDDDEFVIKTDPLKANGHAGKAKAVVPTGKVGIDGFGDAAEDDESELYS